MVSFISTVSRVLQGGRGWVGGEGEGTGRRGGGGDG